MEMNLQESSWNGNKYSKYYTTTYDYEGVSKGKAEHGAHCILF